MWSCENIKCEVEAGVALLTLNRPRALNALTLDMLKSMTETLSRWEEDEEVQDAVRKMKDADGLTLGECDQMRREVLRLNQTVRGRRLGKEVAVIPYCGARTTRRTTESPDDSGDE